MNKERHTLNRNYEFQRVYHRGKNFVSPILVTYVFKKRDGGINYGISASKKIGCAVERNRARRIIRAAALNCFKDIEGSYDIVFVSRRATVNAKSTEIQTIMAEQLKEAGVIQ
ncbi:MAG: ribonuclease P protein component [Oscillospiraceae bacterium]|nr:ribonuclease P protein component [Oscillospiraceae bacterium]